MQSIRECVPNKDGQLANIIGRIPNGGHLYRIREALGSGHAAVMIGAGFSLNAQNGNRLPLWDGLIESLLCDLYASEADKAAARKRLGGTSGMLRLAEEYEAVLTRAQLDKRLHELLPDAGVIMPGELHTKLLALNWADVYTTNYDTLLERTLDTDRRAFNPRIKRRYQVVVAAEDVPFSKSNGRPRIVKLHGSLRTGSRLIVTEEDYRSYPGTFAPFVNTVQQSMLENVFCLLGFSGDDPNFLAWTGWVRDRLGDKTPPIYLITFKPVPEGQRLTLEGRNIFPIDISQLGASAGKGNAAAALSALLNFWADSPPPRRTDWPYQRPVDTLKEREPTIAQLIEWTANAGRNRDEYPGWLTAPADNRARLTGHSAIGQARLAYRRHKDNLPLWFKLVFLREVTWILDETLNLIGSQLAEEIEPALNGYTAGVPSASTPSLPEVTCLQKPSESELKAIWARLVITMLAEARECSNTAKFDHWMQTLQASLSLGDMPEIRRLALHEQILLKLEQQRRGEAFEILQQLALVDGSGDLYWPVRIGALYGELGWTERGRDLVRSGVHAIREAIQFEGESTRLVSREQWAERLLDGLNFATERRPVRRRTVSGVSGGPMPPEVTLRETVPREEHAPQTDNEEDEDVYRDIDARDNIEHPNFQVDILLREIKAADELLQHNKLDFDAKNVPSGVGLSLVRSQATQAAISFSRLVEKVAFVPALGEVGFSGRDLASCYRILSMTQDSEKSLRMLFRANNEAAAESLGLALVDQLSHERALEIFQRSISEIGRVIGSPDIDWDHATVTQLRLAMGLASRVAFRLHTEQAVAMLDVAIQLYVLPQVQTEFSLHQGLAQFLERTLRLLPRKELANNSLRLLQLSPANLALLRRSVWPSIVEFLTDEGASPDASANWHAMADTVLNQAASVQLQDAAASYHYARLDWLYRHGLMTQVQESRFASLIWRDGGIHGLPSILGFYRGAVLTWPALTDKMANDSFRDWLRDETIEPIVTVSQVNGTSRPGISSVREAFLTNVLLSGNKGVTFPWTRADLLAVVAKIEKWWRDEGPYLMQESRGETRREFAWGILTSRLKLIAHVVHRIIAPGIPPADSERQRLSDWFAELWNSGMQLDVPLVPLLFAGLLWWPERSAKVIDMSISALSLTTDRGATNAALSAAGHWLLSEEQQSEASRRYVTYLIDSVGCRNTPCLDLKISNITELVRLGAQRHFETHCETLCSSLSLLLQELRNDTPAVDSVAFASKPLLRLAVVSALVAMGERFSQAKELAAWDWAMRVAESDSMLIVRKLPRDLEE